MAKDEVHMGDIGTIFRRTLQDGTTAVDISGATTIQIHFWKPKWKHPVKKTLYPEEVVKKTATLTSGGADGKMQYTTVSGDLDRPGKWRLQCYIVDGSSNEWYSDWQEFTVHPNVVETVSTIS